MFDNQRQSSLDQLGQLIFGKNTVKKQKPEWCKKCGWTQMGLYNPWFFKHLFDDNTHQVKDGDPECDSQKSGEMAGMTLRWKISLF